MNKKKLLISALCAAAAVLLVWRFHPTAEMKPPVSGSPLSNEKATVVEATCTEAGYTLFENTSDGSIRIEDGAPAAGHDFFDADNKRICRVCGYEEPAVTPQMIARIDLTGDMTGISKNQRVTLTFDFFNETHDFSCYSFTSWQGHSSLSNSKKNYTIRLFRNQALTDKYRLTFNDWQLEHKYVLKANYNDVTQSRNLICARLWGQMAETRGSLPQRLRLTSNYGAVDGFPAAVWVNGEFHGLYTMNLHKDDDLYSMYQSGRDAIMICNAQTMDEAFFRAEAAFKEDISDWEVEFSAPDQTAWAQEHFNRMIRFVMESDDETFRMHLHDYLDVDAAIDYLLFMYAAGLTDSAAKDLVMITYDGGPWIATVYDMEDAFGLSADGSRAAAADFFLPTIQNGIWQSNTGSLLWDRLLQNFGTEICTRYQLLRRDALSQENMAAQAKAVLDSVPEHLIEADMALYPDRPMIEDPSGQILNYIGQRLPILDDIFSLSNE